MECVVRGPPRLKIVQCPAVVVLRVLQDYTLRSTLELRFSSREWKRAFLGIGEQGFSSSSSHAEKEPRRSSAVIPSRIGL